MPAYRVTLIVGRGQTCGLIFRACDCHHIASFDDMSLATTICSELNQAAHAAAAAHRKEYPMKKVTKPMSKPMKPAKKGKKGC